MTHDEAMQQINDTQDFYINELVNKINDLDYKMLKRLNFTSQTGTGKTNMMAKLICRFPNYFFIVTTLSRGQLNKQTTEKLEKLCVDEEGNSLNNFIVYGTQDYRVNSKLQAQEILDRIPKDRRCIWLRDEAHIKTNRFDELLVGYEDVANVCYAVINISATNCDGTGVECNFEHTMMLRTVNQKIINRQKGPIEAIEKLLEVKEQHKSVPNYNPCAIFRLVNTPQEWYDRIIEACDKYHLKHIDISSQDDYEKHIEMKDLTEDDSIYDVIIHKFKIVEGVDIRRAHILYMDNQPNNIATTIQCVGRCRRNALLYRDDIDILAPENKQLLNDTRQCYVFYNVFNTETYSEDEELAEELQNAFCPFISCQKIKSNTVITVENGQMPNGLYIMELCYSYNPPIGYSGTYKIVEDKELGFNVIEPITSIYDRSETDKQDDYVYFMIGKDCKKCRVSNLKHFPINNYKSFFNFGLGREDFVKTQPHYRMDGKRTSVEKVVVPESVVDVLIKRKTEIDNSCIKNNVKKNKSNYVGFKPFSFMLFREFENVEELENAGTETVTEQDIDTFYQLTIFQIKNIQIKQEDISQDTIDTILKEVIANIDLAIKSLLSNNIIVVRTIKPENIEKYYEDCSSKEYELCSANSKVRLFENYLPYSKTLNDRELAIIGIDAMRMYKNDADKSDIIWTEAKSVSNKLSYNTKFNGFIEKKYSSEIEYAKEQLKNLSKGKNDFNFDERCNSMLGYVVEYYSKYLVYGEGYLAQYLQKAQDESHTEEINDFIIVRACMLKYKANMMSAFGKGVGRVIKNVSAEELIQENYKEFINTVVLLGQKTKDYVMTAMYSNREPICNIDPNLSVLHITGLADYITEDTILDVKVKNYIEMDNIKQVLAYHYLSTKRSDLNIQRVIVYDAVSGQAVIVPISEQNIKQG